MARETSERNFEYLDLNNDNPLLRQIRPCKAIAPNNENVIGGAGYSNDSPRIVKTNFKIPSNWHVVISYSNGQPILDAGGHKIIQERPEGIQAREAGVEDWPKILVHTCQKPYNNCSDLAGGFYAEWRPMRKLISAR